MENMIKYRGMVIPAPGGKKLDPAELRKRFTEYPFMNSINDIWDAVLDVLRSKLTEISIKTWFDDCTPIELTDGKFITHTGGNGWKRDMIVSRYGKIIEDALREIFSFDFEFVMLIDEEMDEYRAEKKDRYALPEMDGYTFDNFIVGNSNKYAHAAALGVSKNPGSRAYNPLFIYGNSGLGKTHLLLAIGSAIHESDPKARIAYVKGDDFTVEMVKSIKDGSAEEFRKKYRNVDLFLVDDIQFISGKEATQEEFFHTFNNIYEAGHQIVITSDRPPMDMLKLDDRLRTRFEGGLMADVQPPDVETRMAIIRNKAGQLGMVLSDEVVQFIAEAVTSNIRQIEGVVKRITALRQMTGDDININTVKRAMQDVVRMGDYVPTPDIIIEETARYYSISPDDIKGQKRSKNIAIARHVSIYLIRSLTGMSLNDIGGVFQDRNHSTIISSIRKIEGTIKTDPEMAATIRDITSNINSRQR